LEVADIFRGHGPAWREANAGHVSLGQLKVMSAIENCRTAALGGHVARCEDCAHEDIAYNSCLMGKSSNGELARRHRHFSVNCSAFCLHNGAVLRLRRLGHRWPIVNGDEHVGDLLLSIKAAGTSAERAERTVR
jgi:Transposase zinc-binding domain